MLLHFDDRRFYRYLVAQGKPDLAALSGKVQSVWPLYAGTRASQWGAASPSFADLCSTLTKRLPWQIAGEVRYCLPLFFALCPGIPGVIPSPLECLLHFELNRLAAYDPMPGTDPPVYEGHADHIPHALKVLWVAHRLVAADGAGWLRQAVSRLDDRGTDFREYVGYAADGDVGRGPCVFGGGALADEAVVYAGLVLACLFHDLGYVHRILVAHDETAHRHYPGWFGQHAVAEKLLSGVRGSYFAFLLGRLVDRGIGPKAIQASWAPYHRGHEAIRWGIERNHGFAGACILLETFDSLPGKSPRFWAAVQLAAAAIGFHDLRHGPQRPGLFSPVVSFSQNPVGYVLYMADQLQVWGRLKLEYEARGRSVVVKTAPAKREVVVSLGPHAYAQPPQGCEPMVQWTAECPGKDAVVEPLAPPFMVGNHPSPQISGVWVRT